jgi:hypothetical protein
MKEKFTQADEKRTSARGRLSLGSPDSLPTEARDRRQMVPSERRAYLGYVGVEFRRLRLSGCRRKGVRKTQKCGRLEDWLDGQRGFSTFDREFHLNGDSTPAILSESFDG